MARRTEYTEAELAAIAEHERAEMGRPLKWYRAPAGELATLRGRKLLAEAGFEGLGRLTALRSLLAAAEGHRVDLGDELEASLLAGDLGLDGTGELGEFLALLARLGYVDGDLLAEGRVCVPEVDESALRMGHRIAVLRVNGARGGRPPKRRRRKGDDGE